MKRTSTCTFLAVAVLILAGMAAADIDQWAVLAEGASAWAPEGDWAEYCAENCERRCSKAGERDRCLKYCGICCDNCHCVPPGTYGNKDACLCYRDLKNSRGQPKCP